MNRKIVLSNLFLAAILLFGCSANVEQSPVSTSPNAGPDKQIPITWADLNLTGRLLFINYDSSDFSSAPGIQSLDLATGTISTLFQTESGGWIYYISASPDGKTLVISHIPPSDGTTAVAQALYTMPTDGSASPQLLVAPPTVSDQYIQVEWSPDGRYIYYVHVNQKLALEPNQLSPVYTLYRISYPDGAEEKVADNAFWPRLSADSSTIVYIHSDPFQPKNLLYVANADGGDAHEVVLSDSWYPEIKDAPILLPDGKTILFSAPVASATSDASLLDKLMGVTIAKAHSVPSDWWSVSTDGGLPERLTQILTVNLYASLSPDKTRVASLSGSGIFVMNFDGSDLRQIITNDGLFGSIAWIP